MIIYCFTQLAGTALGQQQRERERERERQGLALLLPMAEVASAQSENDTCHQLVSTAMDDFNGEC